MAWAVSWLTWGDLGDLTASCRRDWLAAADAAADAAAAALEADADPKLELPKLELEEQEA